jgi:hypothetical protein
MKITKARLKQIIKEELALMVERKVDPNRGGIKPGEPSDDVKSSRAAVKKHLKDKGILDDKGNLAKGKVTADARKALEGSGFDTADIKAVLQFLDD